MRFDPARRKVIARIPVQGGKLAFAYLSIWETTGSHQLDRIDLHTNKVVNRVRLAPGANNWGDELAIGDEQWSELHAGSFARLVLATSQQLHDDPRIDVLLPMAHAYERQGTITNLEGRIQRQEGGASPPPHARADWGIVGALAQQLGIPGCPGELHAIRSLLADEHPALTNVLREEALIARV